MHNASMADLRIIEPTKPSKLKRIKSNVVVAGKYIIPAAAFGGMMYFTVKMNQMELEIAKINLAAAELNHQS